MSISIEDLGLAYRKAKVDLYYSTNPSLDDIADYEMKLPEHLNDLLAKINGLDESWVGTSEFFGDWTVTPKEVYWPEGASPPKGCGNGIVFSSPADKWAYDCEVTGGEGGSAKKPNAEFRVMAHCTLDFHVLSTLWLLNVGHLFDGALTSCAYGNRLRRTQDGNKLNPYSLGSFVPYLRPFREWRDRGIKVIGSALESKKRIAALTADVTSFYHELNPSFMLDKRFVEGVLGLELSGQQWKLNRLFVNALKAWAENSPLKRGLPVGLPASGVIANVALVELDRAIEQQIIPLYYGRYVDDILLVIENAPKFSSSKAIWEWMFTRSENKLAWVEGKEGETSCFQPDYFRKGESKCKIEFSNSKNKLFLLEGETGKNLLTSIERQIQERASEWRALPHLPNQASRIGTDMVAAVQIDGESADSLRKTDGMTMRRAAFAMKLRDLEAYERDLPPDDWKDHRQAFFDAYVLYVLVLPHFFELAMYVPRVIRLATASQDFEKLRKIIEALGLVCSRVREDCSVKIKAYPDFNSQVRDLEIVTRWEDRLITTVVESIRASFPPRLTSAGKNEWRIQILEWQPTGFEERTKSRLGSVSDLQSWYCRLFSYDLAHLPFRFVGLPPELVAQRGIPNRKSIICCDEYSNLVPEIQQGLKSLTKWIRFRHLPNGLLFATRPFNLAELSMLSNEVHAESGKQVTEDVVFALRGFKLNEKMPRQVDGVLKILDGTPPNGYGIAVSSWETSNRSWIAAVTKQPDPDSGRYSRLNRMLGNVMKDSPRSRYLILPELALPSRWFVRIAQKLHRCGISLITGIEYLHARRGRVRNQVWAALSHDGLGFRSMMIYRQDKQRPALHEKRELQNLAGLYLSPEKRWVPPRPPIIQHGDFRFALLVCSELTNIDYRASLRGQIDALFVLEWNPDIETFNALVESAALDIHTYVIQCNDRKYGDSRIRAPYKESWMRDILRVKGGLTDYCVIGEIEVKALRKFQSSHLSPGKPFKPVPDGFEINPVRWILPCSETPEP